MPRAFSEKEKKTVKERLLREGDKRFSRYGLSKTSVEELALAAHISKGAFYSFYESKEALYMDVVEEAEKVFRRQILAAIDLPGPNPRARFLAVLKQAFTLWKTIPVLQFFTSSDFARLARKVPAEIIQKHMEADLDFFKEFITHCQNAGIPIRVQAEELSGLLYSLFFASLHEHEFGPNTFTAPLNQLIELVAAFFLGEVSLDQQSSAKEITK